MAELEKNENFCEKSVVELEGYHFFVPDYQRGYKWRIRQVLDLLEDLEEHDINNGFYCLQPLAVKSYKESEITKYEVIDGQQRLTTILIILNIIAPNEKPIYAISYDTRERSQDFLLGMNQGLSKYKEEIKSVEKETSLLSEINKNWSIFIKSKQNEGKEYDNVDFYHFFLAYLTISWWFSRKNQKKIGTFLNKLKQDTKFIWYEDTTPIPATIVFRNLNSGKINLTNAELVKALFINAIRRDILEVQRLEQNLFAAEWDAIEKSLHDEAFWYFINPNRINYATHIDLLLELELDNTLQKNTDRLAIYRKFSKMNSYSELENKWKNIKALFHQLEEWYNDRKTYHLIGFLLHGMGKSIPHILKIKKGNKKPLGKIAFQEKLNTIIKNEFSRKDEEKYVYELSNLQYGVHNKEIKRILLLHNIKTYEQLDSHYRFAFHKEENVRWSLEHIHAKRTDDIQSLKDLEEWIIETKKISKEEDRGRFIFSKLEKLQQLIAEQKRENGKKAKITSAISEIMGLIEERLEVDNIWNLALLDKNINSKLSNRNFSKKRKEIKGILQLNQKNKNKAFIPICTQNVFMKYYSSDITQISFWSIADKQAYKEDIAKVLKEYLLRPEQEAVTSQTN